MGDRVHDDRKGRVDAEEHGLGGIEEPVASHGKASRRHILKVALASGPVIMTLKSGPARAALSPSALLSATHVSHRPQDF